MYLNVLKYVAKYESHRSLPPNPKQRHALTDHLPPKLLSEINAQKHTQTFKHAHINIKEKEMNLLLSSSTQS